MYSFWLELGISSYSQMDYVALYSVMTMDDLTAAPKNLASLDPLKLKVPVLLEPALTLKVVEDVVPATIVCLNSMESGAVASG